MELIVVKIFSWIIIINLCFGILNLIWLSIYCRIERMVDRKKFANAAINNTEDTNVIVSNNKKNMPGILKTVYKSLDHYMYGWMRFCILKVGNIPSNRIRKILYKYVFCMKISSKTVISGNCEIRSPWNIELKKCIIAGGCVLDGRAGILIEDNVVLGMFVHIWTEEHDLQSHDFAVNEKHRGKVVIDKHAWICSDSTLLPGVYIGEGTVVATKAVITKTCEAFKIYAGIPGKVIGERTKDLDYELTGKPHWHFY